MRSDWVDPAVLEHILAALTPENELALRVSIATGLRISDVLAIKSKSLRMGPRFTIHESKTGKARRIYLPRDLYSRLLDNMGEHYAFPGRSDPRRHRTRQAVWKDLHRAAKAFRVSDAVGLSPHTARKVFAVDQLEKSGSLERVQRLLNHSDPTITALYALAAEVTRRKLGGTGDPRKPSYRRR